MTVTPTPRYTTARDSTIRRARTVLTESATHRSVHGTVVPPAVRLGVHRVPRPAVVSDGSSTTAPAGSIFTRGKERRDEPTTWSQSRMEARGGCGCNSG